MKWLLICFAFILGILFAQINHLRYFTVDPNIDIVEVFTLIFTIVIAIWVSKILPKKLETSRTEKDLFLRRSFDIYAGIENFSKKCKNGRINYFEATSKCKQISDEINSICELLVENNYDFGETKILLMGLVNDIRQNLTTTPIENTHNPEIVIQNNVVKLSGNKLIKLATDFETLKKKFFNFQIALNKQ